MREPHFAGASKFVQQALLALSNAGTFLRVDDAERQHPFFYRANQFWRQLEEFEAELSRAAKDAVPRRRRG